MCGFLSGWRMTEQRNSIHIFSPKQKIHEPSYSNVCIKVRESFVHTIFIENFCPYGLFCSIYMRIISFAFFIFHIFQQFQ